MKLAFGKFKGQTVESLKQSSDGVSYLEWGAANLRDGELRKLFADTLSGMTDHEHAIIIADQDGIGYDEALIYVRNLRAMEAEDAAREAAETQRQDAIFQRWAAESGQPAAKLKAVSDRFFMDWWEQPASRFSSPVAHAMFCRYMDELHGKPE